MPRKAKKTEKPPLPFLEHPVGGARLQNVPEVRAALNPKEFFTETQNSSSLNSWVKPEFDRSVAAAFPVKRGSVPNQKDCTALRHTKETDIHIQKKECEDTFQWGCILQ
ncbi:hypothetical protein NQZ68_014019 [Dissostichus eleginoides]|nr:hypothetical protein NQZ68_014019 [Dissostichus eleginoides]